MPPDPFTGIPADIQAFRDGWTEITDHGHPYEVVLARDFSDDYLAERICGTFRNMGDKVTSSLVSLGKEVSRASILELLLGDVAIVRLEQFTTEMLVKRNFPPLVPYEYREFLYTRWYRSRFNLSNDKSFSHFMPPLSKSLDIIIMDPHRFATIQSCTRGFSQAGRTGSEDSDVWMEAGAMLRKNHAIGVSPDAICRLVVEDAPDPVLCCLEIKTRVSESTIAKAELARKKHGSFVNCYYGDAVFNDCVPAANRSQVLHQALVTGFQHGVFVVCKLEEGQGSIVQIVAIRISTEKRDEYAKNLCKVVNPLLGFLHNEDVIARGILMDKEGDLRPTKPVSIYKHSTQYRYNKHKPGLDKNTEISDRVAFHTTGPLKQSTSSECLESISGSDCDFTVATCARVTPFIGTGGLAAQKAIPLFLADVPQEEREERQFKSEFSEYKRKHGWPIRKFALKKFASDPFLKKLRLCTFVDHRPQRIRDVQPVIRENGTSQKVVRRKCVLCFGPGKMIPGTSTIKSKEIANNSTYMCPTCMVVLCKKTVGNSGAKSCHTLWHERHNLEAEGSKCRKRLRVAREMNDDEAQKRKLHATNASIKRHSPAKTSQQTQRSQTQVAINDPQDPQDSFDAVENVVKHVLENLMEMEHGEEHGDEEKEEDKHDFLDMEEYSDGSDEKE
ncbi:hypothetical protein IV203_025135 [Nitzschia inconspicua]|uniref:YqaJ viral recombinase domain-containing protein n=1 Tax=Nitzschia inconspicua TaxID=303405 RepID=A0A9K3LPR8_9STRA|nr:hypothetical protein IV203_025135 [Nitzschia inconspicua]